jgi:glycosyltransferase involved in cell wall biosynthesis
MPRPFLSVIVVLYEMQRAAVRTLHSLSAAYQQEVDAGDYEVHVVENGSKHPVDRQLVESLGQNFRYHFLEDAPPSPAYALNYGVRKSRGDYVALMIDGAHILTPKVFASARCAARAFKNPIVAVRSFYLGPGQQPWTIRDGYNADVEERLLSQIRWPEDPYRLFEIGTPMDSDRAAWFDPISESNCLILPRWVYKAIGGSDESFHLPGGGLLNSDTFSRCVQQAGTQLVVLLGEGSFHQVHGGIRTNTDPEESQRLVQKYREQYRRIRGQVSANPTTPIEFLGSLHSHSLLV